MNLGMQLAGGAAPRPAQAGDHGVGAVEFPIRSGTEALADAIFGGAEIANPATLLAIGKIAEMSDESSHPAFVAVRIAEHQVQLLLLLVGLRDVGRAPVVVAAA